MPTFDVMKRGADALNRLAKRFGFQVVRTESLDRLIAAVNDAGGLNTIESSGRMTAAWPGASAVASDTNAAPGNEALSARHFHDLGMAARAAADDAKAFKMFARAISIVPRYAPSRDELRAMSGECLAKIRPTMAIDDRLILLARALEMDPVNAKVRGDLHQAHVLRRNSDDLTKMCFIFYDEHRARQVHSEAYRRALEFVTIGGVVGDVLEFGVLGGWSARIICEIMRDIFNLNDLHLFDSFEGLPEYSSAVDRDSYEIGGRAIWGDRMKFPDEFLKRFGKPHYLHIHDRLSEIIRSDRIILHKGFYSQTLNTPLNTKAAVVHLDCDLYQSTVEVLWGLHRMEALQDGTVMLFDDWNCNRGNPNYGERRAWNEFLAGQTRFTATPWFTYGYNGAAYILHDTTV
jgi:O-methyltransferase